MRYFVLLSIFTVVGCTSKPKQDLNAVYSAALKFSDMKCTQQKDCGADG